jgi:hypothetical protein
MIVSGAHDRSFRGRYYIETGDTLPILTQPGANRRLKLGLLRLQRNVRGSQPTTQEIALFAAMTRIQVIYWGFECPRCLRYARKLFLPESRGQFLCNRCHGLRYLSQTKLDAIQRQADRSWDERARAEGLCNARVVRCLRKAGLIL